MSIITNPAIYDVLKKVIISSLPMGDVIYNAVEVSGEMVKSAEGKNIKEFALEVRKQEMQMEFAKHQAKVSQELAIANRINNALEVEIEEFYELVGKGKGGLGVDSANGITLGVSGEAHRVTRRIYRFKGNSGQASELVSQQLGEEIEKIVKAESEEQPKKVKKT
ncbi:hypothetical protein [Serratia proteamaculans]